MNLREKFYTGNIDIFLKYFDSRKQYEALIRAGNFEKMDGVIRDNSSFSLREFINQINNK